MYVLVLSCVALIEIDITI